MGERVRERGERERGGGGSVLPPYYACPVRLPGTPVHNPSGRYESEMHSVEDEMKMIFVTCEFNLETTQVR